MLSKRSFSLAGHRTSVALEPQFWAAVEAIAEREGVPLASLVARVDAGRVPPHSLASALRIMALADAQAGPPHIEPSGHRTKRASNEAGTERSGY